MEMENKLIEEFGKGYLEPFSEEENALKAKSSFLRVFLGEKEASREFLDFFYNNDIHEKMWNQAKGKEVEKISFPAAESEKEYDKNFPALSPEKVKPEKSETPWQALAVPFLFISLHSPLSTNSKLFQAISQLLTHRL